MASTSNVRSLPATPRRGGSDRKVFAAAVLTGIYASNGYAILNSRNHVYAGWKRNAARVALEQADEVIRRMES